MLQRTHGLAPEMNGDACFCPFGWVCFPQKGDAETKHIVALLCLQNAWLFAKQTEQYMEETNSALNLCNIALSKLGESPIAAIDPNGSPAARLCYLHYHPARRETLCAARWSFATKRTVLGSSESSEEDQFVSGHQRHHSLPADCLRVLSVKASSWTLQGRAVYSAISPLQISYTFDCEDAELFEPLFCDALSTRLAEKLCIPLTASSTAREALTQEFHRIILPMASTVNAVQSFSNDTHPLYRLWKQSYCCRNEEDDCEQLCE